MVRETKSVIEGKTKEINSFYRSYMVIVQEDTELRQIIFSPYLEFN